MQVFGITHNDAESHQKFTEANKLNFPLLLDTNRNLALLFGAVKKLDDERLKRMAIVIDKEGKIVKIVKEVNPSTHGADLVEIVKNLEKPKSN